MIPDMSNYLPASMRDRERRYRIEYQDRHPGIVAAPDRYELEAIYNYEENMNELENGDPWKFKARLRRMRQHHWISLMDRKYELMFPTNVLDNMIVDEDLRKERPMKYILEGESWSRQTYDWIDIMMNGRVHKLNDELILWRIRDGRNTIGARDHLNETLWPVIRPLLTKESPSADDLKCALWIILYCLGYDRPRTWSQ